MEVLNWKLKEHLFRHALLRSWAALGFNDEDLRRLENQLLQNPKIGAVIRGTGKMRKCALPLKAVVKVEVQEFVMSILKSRKLFISCFRKNELENLTKEERNHLKKQIDILESNL